MRRTAIAIRSLLTSLIRDTGPEGFALGAGYLGLSVVGWSIDWRVGATVLCVGLLVAGIALARPAR